MEPKSEPTPKRKKSWPPRGVTAKKPQKVYTVKAERRPDGTRVERTYDDTGKFVSEWEARVYVQRFGADDTGAVFLNVDAARPDFDHANAAFKGANGKFCGRHWRLPAKVGLAIVGQLRDDGFIVEEGSFVDATQMYRATMEKFLGPLNYRHGSFVVELTPAGFSVHVDDGGIFPCTLAEALVLDDAGACFTREALACVATVRKAAGFANAGRGRVESVTPEQLGTM